MIKIKNCGLKSEAEIDQSIATGASFVGFVHHTASPRHVELPQLEALIAYAKPQIKTVAVLVAPTEAELWEIANIAKPDYLQLHHIPSVAYVQKVQDETGIPVISAIAVRSEADFVNLPVFEEISAFLLFDAARAGSGKAFDWHLLKNLPLKKSWFLAGGLTPSNVAEAILITQAPMVDVSSGIEDSPGKKSLEKIAAFNKAVLNAADA